MAAVIGILLGLTGPVGQVVLGMQLFSRVTGPRSGAVCAANVNSLGKAVAMWHAEHNDKWMDLYAQTDRPYPDNPAADWGKADAFSAGNIEDLDPDSNVQHWWLLCDAGTIAEAGFTCPSDPQDPHTPQHNGGKTKGFGSWANVSYGLQPMLNDPKANPGRPGKASQDGGMIVAGDRPQMVGGVYQPGQPNANHGADKLNVLIRDLSIRRIEWTPTTGNRLGPANDDIYVPDGPGDGAVTKNADDSYLMYVEQAPEPDDEQ